MYPTVTYVNLYNINLDIYTYSYHFLQFEAVFECLNIFELLSNMKHRWPYCQAYKRLHFGEINLYYKNAITSLSKYRLYLAFYANIFVLQKKLYFLL